MKEHQLRTIILSMFICALGIALVASADGSTTQPTNAQKTDLLWILEQVTDHAGEFANADDNSWVEIQSDGLKKVVASGPSALPALVRILNDPRLSFDTFARAYYATYTILESIKPDIYSRWCGFASIKYNDHVMVISPAMQKDPEQFRKDLALGARDDCDKCGIYVEMDRAPE